MGGLNQSQKNEILDMIRQEFKTYFTVKSFPGLLKSDVPTTGPGAGNTSAGMVAVFKNAQGQVLEGRSLSILEDAVTVTLLTAKVLSLQAQGAKAILNTDNDLELSAGTGHVLTLENNAVVIGRIDADGFTLAKVGAGFSVKEGTNASMGKATLVGGTKVVSTTKVTASTRIFLSAVNGSANAGFLDTATRTPGTSFTITSSNALDDRDVAYLLVEPAA